MDILFQYVFRIEVFILVLAIVILKKSIIFVPQNRAYLIERFGKFQSTREAGLNFLIPFIDHIGAWGRKQMEKENKIYLQLKEQRNNENKHNQSSSVNKE